MITRTITVLAATALAATGLAAGTANAMPTDFHCTAGDLDTTLVYGGAGAGQRYASVQFTAKPGVSCTLPGSLSLDLVGAHDVLIDNQARGDAPAVRVSEGSPAYLPLHWSAIEEQQQTPLALIFTAPQQYNPRGDYSDPQVTLPWTFGGVDAAPENHTIDAGAVTPGPAPTA